MNADRLSAVLAENIERALAHEDDYVAILERELVREAGRASRRFQQRVTQHGFTAAAVSSEAAMVALYPDPEEALIIEQPNGEPAEILHVTLAYLGEIPADIAEAAVAAIRPVAAAAEPLSGVIGGVGCFGNVLADIAKVADRVRPAGGYGDTGWDGATSTVLWIPADWTTNEEAAEAERQFLAISGVENVFVDEAESGFPDGWLQIYHGMSGTALVETTYPSIALPDVPGLVELRQAVCEALGAAGIEYATNHGFTAHITVAYESEPTLPSSSLTGLPLSFDRLSVTRGDMPRDFPLGQSLTAAGPSGWSSPHPDEVIDVEALVTLLRTKADEVRRAAIAELGAGLPIDWDVTNPLVGNVLAQSASKVTHIAETTRLNVMRSIRQAYEQGLSIPDTAKLIQSGMAAASPARARLIARTELTGVANGGAVAAARLVSRATGVTYYKTWMTAIGAEHPRHETYFGLNGQTTTMTGLFTVGSSQLAYPGDPAGRPREVCNCRCSVSFSETMTPAASG